MEPSTVIADGEVIYQDHQLMKEFPTFVYPEHIRNSINLKQALTAADFPLTAADFQLESKSNNEETKVNVI